MLLAIIPQGSSSGVLDLANSSNDAIYRLGLQGPADLAAADWISTAELLQFADDTVKRLSRDAGLFIVWDTSVAITAGTSLSNLPSSHVFTLLAVLILPAGVPAQFLRLTSARDLWALDANWPTTIGDAQRASLDAGAVGTITLYPTPLTGGTLGLVAQEYPAAIAAGASHLQLQTVLQDYFTYAMLAGALGKESDHAVPEMAAHYAKRAGLYEQVISHLWGAGL